MDTIEIKRDEYDELKARPEGKELDELAAKLTQAEKDLEAAEAAKVKAETEKAELQGKLNAAEEQARQATLRDERLDALGEGFVAALGEKTKDRLRKQAGSLADDEWTARLDELEELTGKKRDLGKANPATSTSADSTFTTDEVARFQGGGASDAHIPTVNERRSVFAGLTR